MDLRHARGGDEGGAGATRSRDDGDDESLLAPQPGGASSRGEAARWPRPRDESVWATGPAYVADQTQIAVFTVDQTNGLLTATGTPTPVAVGSQPYNLTTDPADGHLTVADRLGDGVRKPSLRRSYDDTALPGLVGEVPTRAECPSPSGTASRDRADPHSTRSVIGANESYGMRGPSARTTSTRCTGSKAVSSAQPATLAAYTFSTESVSPSE